MANGNARFIRRIAQQPTVVRVVRGAKKAVETVVKIINKVAKKVVKICKKAIKVTNRGQRVCPY
jgi:histone H3/H4